MNTDGSGRTMLPDWQAVETHPDWSHDGNKVVFTSDTGNAISNPNGDQKIYVMNADGSGQTRLADNSGYDWHPSWGPAAAPALTGTRMV